MQALGELSRIAGWRGEQAVTQCAGGGFSTEEVLHRVFTALGRVAVAEGDVEETTSWLERAFAAAFERRNLQLASDVVEALAEVALARGDGRCAARLLGTGAVLRGMPISGCVDVARVAAAGKALIGDDAFETEYERGLAVSPDEALALAGGAHSPSSSTPV
jgi:hypothetical protein